MSNVTNLHADPPQANSGFCMTLNAQRMMALFSTCQDRGELGLLVGESGVGKTTAALAYAREANDLGATYCRMIGAAAKRQPGMIRIADALGSKVSPNASAYEAHSAILAIGKIGGGHVLLLDEANYMDDDLLESIRDIHDETHGGIVLIGGINLLDRLEDGRRNRRFGAFMSRVGQNMNIKGVLDADIDALCQLHGIAGKNARDLVRRAARRPGGMHKATRLIGIARKIAASGHAIGLEHIQQAELLVGGAA